jgi:hypothetical protein
MRKTRGKRRQSIEAQTTLHEESGPVINNLMSREFEDGARGKSLSVASAYSIEGKSLVVLQVSCRVIYNKALKFWNLVDTYNPDVVMGKESWLKEDISNAEVFGLILQLSEGIGLPVVGEFLSVSKILLPVNSC